MDQVGDQSQGRTRLGGASGDYVVSGRCRDRTEKWRDGRQNYRTTETELQNYRTTELQNYITTEQQNYRTTELQNRRRKNDIIQNNRTTER